MKCKECPYFWDATYFDILNEQGEDEAEAYVNNYGMQPTCQYKYNDGYAPCEC